MTPMKRLQNQFKKLNNIIEKNSLFTMFVLNKSSHKHIPYVFAPRIRDPLTGKRTTKTESKGVQSDHIKIYSSLNSDLSFAFIFDYVNKEEPVFFFNLKINKSNDSIQSSEPMNFETLKSRINIILENLDYLSNSGHIEKDKDIINVLTTVFLGDDFDLLDAVLQEERLIEDALGEDKEIIEKELRVLKNMKSEYSKTENKAKQKIAETEEQKLVDKLEQDLQHAKLRLIDKSKEIVGEHGLPDLNKKIIEKQNLLADIKKRVKDKLLSLKKKMPTLVSQQLKDFDIE